MGVFDNPAGLFENLLPVGQPVNIGDSNNQFENLYVKNGYIDNITVSGNETNTGTQTANGFLLADGADKNYAQFAYGSGTGYFLTATSAALAFGTTSPSITFNYDGVYLIMAKVNLEFVGATFAANRTVILKLHRTNNTAGDLDYSATTIGTNIVTTANGVLANSPLPVIIYNATAGDIVTIFGNVSVLPTAGLLQATEAFMTVFRLYSL